MSEQAQDLRRWRLLCAIMFAVYAFTIWSCTARDRHAIRTIADIADNTCKEGDSPKECLIKVATDPKLDKAESAAKPNGPTIQVYCSQTPNPVPSGSHLSKQAQARRIPNMKKQTDRQRLEVWLSQQILTEQADGAPLRLFKVSHLVEGAVKNQSILEVYYRDQTEAGSIATQIIEHCQGDADVAGGVQKYAIKAQYGALEVETRGGRFVLRLRGEAEDDEGENALSSLAVSDRGVLSQLMRHQEGMMKLVVGVVGEGMDRQNQLLNMLAARLERAETRSAALHDQLEIAANHRTDRELAIRTQLRKERREDMAIEIGTRVLLPKLVENIGTTETQFEILASSMTDEQIAKIGETLTPEQVPMFVSMMRKLEAKKHAKSKGEEVLKAEGEKILAKAEVSTNIGEVIAKAAGEEEPKPEKTTKAKPASDIEDSIVSLMGSMNEEQLNAFMGSLQPEQIAHAAKIMRLMQERAASK